MLFSTVMLLDWAKSTLFRGSTLTTLKPIVPKVVFVFAGKRKCGKDYVTDILLERIGDKVAEIKRLSAPLKKQYAKDHGLDYDQLLSASDYKENYRSDMIRWGESKRDADAGYFARLTTADATKPIWIISDARRPGDIAYFKGKYNTITVRVEASSDVREKRGWKFQPGVDDAPSECGLDNSQWDFVVKNEGSSEDLEKFLHSIMSHPLVK
eukprot:m.155002 g.155002  ORF g.155002 m.155002 type:complete len:211 (-) comp30919_c2_seq2:246-878(-)